MKTVFMSHFVCKLLNKCCIWQTSISYHQRAALRSTSHMQIRTILRVHFKLNRKTLPQQLIVHILDRTITNRISTFTFSTFSSQVPLTLFTKLQLYCTTMRESQIELLYSRETPQWLEDSRLPT